MRFAGLLLVAAMALLVPATARAVDCPWPGRPSTVHADMTMVYVDGMTYPAKGALARSSMITYLQACSNYEAVDTFVDWRALRRAVNTTGIIGIIVWPVLIGTAVVAVMAGRARDSFITAMLRRPSALWTPRERRRVERYARRLARLDARA